MRGPVSFWRRGFGLRNAVPLVWARQPPAGRARALPGRQADPAPPGGRATATAGRKLQGAPAGRREEPPALRLCELSPAAPGTRERKSDSRVTPRVPGRRIRWGGRQLDPIGAPGLGLDGWMDRASPEPRGSAGHWGYRAVQAFLPSDLSPLEDSRSRLWDRGAFLSGRTCQVSEGAEPSGLKLRSPQPFGYSCPSVCGSGSPEPLPFLGRGLRKRRWCGGGQGRKARYVDGRTVAGPQTTENRDRRGGEETEMEKAGLKSEK